MAARFYAITRDEIHDFMTELGFRPLALNDVWELVYGRIVQVGGHRLSLRVYTAVNQGGESRKRGTDAIRLQLCQKVKDGEREEIIPVGQTQKCLRVASWQENLRKAIERITDPEHFRPCPACGHPMVIRQNNTTGGELWGCSMFRLTGCKGKRPNGTPPTSAAVDANEPAPWEIDDLRNKGQL